VNAEQLRDQLVEVLATASAPMSTSQARLAVTEYCRRRGRPVLAEEVYRALVILAWRGVVRRVTDQPGRAAHWELTRRHVRRPAAG
jgi:Fe2+ or Zn2+ uptake regulation protein